MGRLKQLLARLDRIEITLLVFFLVWLALRGPLGGGLFVPILLIALYVLGGIVLVRRVRRWVHHAIWRLRNRLIVAYLFIALVPVLLIVVLAGLGAWALSGQMAAYLVSSEFERRVDVLRGTARSVSRAPAERAEEVARRTAAFLRDRYPGFQLIVDAPDRRTFPDGVQAEAPSDEWASTSGVVVRDGLLYLWAHVVAGPRRVTAMAPLTRAFLADLVPHLGEISLVSFSSRLGGKSFPMRVHNRIEGAEDPSAAADAPPLPPAVNLLDLEVLWGSTIPVAVWHAPGTTVDGILGVHTRISPVMRVIFSQRVDWDQPMLLLGLYIFAFAFLLVEIASLITGVTITRTITNAVHDLYEGTRKVQEGDFSHRIPVKGNDQVADLSRSFNQMTERLETLLAVATEKERLQAELEIAREVQAQLYPKTIPELPTFRITARCNPARTVSGDYYDYQLLDSSRVTLAVGDVCGKGISAALLMATLQSSLRTHLANCLEARHGSGGAGASVPTALLVSQLNRHLYAHTSSEKYATFCFGVYDESTSSLTYTNAGHLPPILLRRGGAIPLDVNGMVVGAFPFATYNESRIVLESGDLLVFYTDGITEPENDYGEMFGEQRLISVLSRHADRGEDEIIAAVFDDVLEWTRTPDAWDDMTILVARRV